MITLQLTPKTSHVNHTIQVYMYLDDNSGLIQNISNILNCCHILLIQLHLKIEADHIRVIVAIL